MVNKTLAAAELHSLIRFWLEDSQCGDTGEDGYWISPENRIKLDKLLERTK